MSEMHYFVPDGDLWACGECGALASSPQWRELHLNWHSELEARIVREAEYAARHTPPAVY